MIKKFKKKINRCRICSGKISQILDLGKQPPANSLKKYSQGNLKKAELKLVRCEKCETTQLSHTISKEYLFNNYVWVTGTSKGANNFSEKFYKMSQKRIKNKNRYILEIASNDGTFLKPFKKNKYHVVGMDPAKNICNIAKKNNIFTINKFFNKKNSVKILNKYKHPSFIFARNVIPHVENIKEIFEGIQLLMDKESIGAIEFHYAKKILDGLQYDSIYHEHIFYFSIKNILNLLAKYKLFGFDAEISPISGGALIIYFSKVRNQKTKLLKKLINLENKKKINKKKTWKKFAKESILHRNKLKKLIILSNDKYKNIFGYGASARSSTLLNFAGINSKHIKGIFDKSLLKNNKYTPGSNILIYKTSKFLKLKPDLIVILAWNFLNEIIRDLRNNYNYKGDFLIPLPYPKIVKK